MYFGPFEVAKQVFYKTKLSFALVNLKPLLPGHVLVCPIRRVSRVHDLTVEETSDLFQTVQKVSKVLEKIYNASAFNIAIQDGAMAGQTVPHVHCHVIPRTAKDLPRTDDIYELLDSADGNITANYLQYMKQKDHSYLAKPDAERTPRSLQEMENEANVLSSYFTED